MSIPFGVTLFAMAGTYTVQLAWAQKWERGPAEGTITLPPGAPSDRLGASGQIWGGNTDRGTRVRPAARKQPSSRTASQNSLLTANLQNKRENLAAGQSSLSPPTPSFFASDRKVLETFICGWGWTGDSLNPDWLYSLLCLTLKDTTP